MSENIFGHDHAPVWTSVRIHEGTRIAIHQDPDYGWAWLDIGRYGAGIVIHAKSSQLRRLAAAITAGLDPVLDAKFEASITPSNPDAHASHSS